MPIDASIPLGVKTDYGSSIDTAAKAMTLKHLMKQDAQSDALAPLQMQSAQLDVNAKQQAATEQEAIKGAFQDAWDPTQNRMDNMKLISGLQRASPKYAEEFISNKFKTDAAFAKQVQDAQKNFISAAGPLMKRVVDDFDQRVKGGVPPEIAWQQVQPQAAAGMEMLHNAKYGPEFTGGDPSQLTIDKVRSVANSWDGSLKLDQDRATAEATADYRDKSLAERSRATDAQERRAAALENAVMAPPKPGVGYRYTDDSGTTQEFIPGGPADPARQKPSDAARKIESFTERMAAATTDMQKILKENPKFDPTNLKDHLADATPGGNYAKSDAYQLYRQAQESWVRAKLRLESGAVIGKDEMNDEIRTYFPQPGDSDALIKQKTDSRAAAEKAIGDQAGPASTNAPGGESATVKWDDLPP